MSLLILIGISRRSVIDCHVSQLTCVAYCRLKTGMVITIEPGKCCAYNLDLLISDIEHRDLRTAISTLP